MTRNPVFCALDTQDRSAAVDLTRRIAPYVGGIKIGKEFFTAHGPEGVRAVTAVGAPLFLDLKYHDIPNTVAGAVRAACALRPAMLNVHAAGGTAMMRAAADAAAEAGGGQRPWVLGVTLLTSLEDTDLQATGITGTARDQVLHLATLAQRAGLDGVVCSAHEITALRAACGPSFKLVVPGLRPNGAAVADQKRVMTPTEALDLGADVLVIGRPITGAGDPAAAARAIAADLRVAAG
ncbi:MAG: orotidine-5'-phosphate decarboxylase [Alphaproteobacteria bacterium]|nr:orotidine-5'-phosphate decarboxylase [Alphaproteobacteria bacterium]